MVYHFGDPNVDIEQPPLPPSKFSWKIDRTVTGTVDGKSGTFTMHLEAKGSTPVAPGAIEGTWVIISGTDGLSSLHGQGTWWNIGSAQLAYEGQIHFDP